jgi:hypothetical protein
MARVWRRVVASVLVALLLATATPWLVSSADDRAVTPPSVSNSPTRTETSCDYYASPKGGSSGASASAPFRISNFWNVAQPGKTLCLLDGSYRGADSMVAPGADVPGLSGTRDNPIIVRALNDGAVTIDGQFARIPVRLKGNSWWVIEGINAKNSNGPVLTIDGGSNNTVVRRSIFWDAHIAKNVSVVGVSGATSDVLLEDVAAFGAGRKVFSASQGPQRTVFRRVWGRWEGSTTQGPKASVTMQYNTDGTTCENCLMTWSSESMPATYTLTNVRGATLNSAPRSSIEQPVPLYTQDFPKPLCSHATILGSIGYVKAGDRWGGFPALIMQGKFQQSCVTVKHTLMVMSPSNPAFGATQGFLMNPVTIGRPTPGTNNVANNTTSIRGKADAWNTFQHTLHSAGTSLGAVANPWTTTGEGANLCYRWMNGALTSIPLWPWPMNERIKAATAAAGAYGAGYPASVVGCGPEQGSCVGGGATRTETDVTGDIETLLGPIAPHCKSH